MTNETKLSEITSKYNLIMIKKWEGLQKSVIYVLPSTELSESQKRALERELGEVFDPEKYSIVYITDLSPSQLQQVLSKFETLYMGDKDLCDSIIAGILTVGHDFRFFVNEKMNTIIKKQLKEILPNY